MQKKTIFTRFRSSLMIDILKKEQLVALSFSLCVVTLNVQILLLLLTSHQGFVFFIRSRTAVAPLERMKILLQVCSSLVDFVFRWLLLFWNL